MVRHEDSSLNGSRYHLSGKGNSRSKNLCRLPELANKSRLVHKADISSQLIHYLQAWSKQGILFHTDVDIRHNLCRLAFITRQRQTHLFFPSFAFLPRLNINLTREDIVVYVTNTGTRSFSMHSSTAFIAFRYPMFSQFSISSPILTLMDSFFLAHTLQA